MTASIHNETFFLETSSGKVYDDCYTYLRAAVTELLDACIVLENPFLSCILTV